MKIFRFAFALSVFTLAVSAATSVEAAGYNRFYPYTYPGDYSDPGTIKNSYNVQRVTDIDFDGKPAFTEYYEDKPAEYSDYDWNDGGYKDPYRFLRMGRVDGRRPAQGAYSNCRCGSSFFRPVRSADGSVYELVLPDGSRWIPRSASSVRDRSSARSARSVGY